MKQSFLVILCVVFLSSCYDKYYEAAPGVVNIITKGGGYRTEGGGLIDTTYFLGTHNIGGPRTKVNITTVTANAQMLPLKELRVIIPAMQNQAVTVDVSLMVMAVPTRIPSLASRMPSWQTKMFTSLETVTKKITQSETKAFNADAADATILNRELLSKKILKEMKIEFNKNNPGFENDFVFIGVVINDIIYPKSVTDGFATIAKAEYNLELAKIRKSKEVLDEELEAQDLESDLAAYAKEGGVMSKQLLKFKSMDNMIQMLQNENATVVIKIKADGSIDWFSK